MPKKRSRGQGRLKMESQNNGQEKKALTGIPDAYTLAANPDEGEVESIMIKQFLNTLAEVSLAVASRNIVRKEEESLD